MFLFKQSSSPFFLFCFPNFVCLNAILELFFQIRFLFLPFGDLDFVNGIIMTLFLAWVHPSWLTVAQGSLRILLLVLDRSICSILRYGCHLARLWAWIRAFVWVWSLFAHILLLGARGAAPAASGQLFACEILAPSFSFHAWVHWFAGVMGC